MEYVISLFLISCSALFSGLTLGLFSLDVHNLRRKAELGEPRAVTVYDLRRRGNLLLSTLLLGNVAVNAILSVYLGSIVSGVVASIFATALIFLFGEIIPQAVISRFALPFGSVTAPLVRVLITMFYPVTYPIAFALDRLLGEEIPTVYSKHELMTIVSEHEDSAHSPIDADEERIVHGALQFSHRRADEVMTSLENTVMFSADHIIDEDLYETISEEGYSRYPVFDGNRHHVIGILFAKDLLMETEGVAIRDANGALERDFLTTSPGTLLDGLLARMLKSRKHIAVVVSKDSKCLGVITLEDIIEEIIQFEIEDEDDD